MPSRARLLVSVVCAAALLLFAHATAHAQQTSTSRTIASVAGHSTRTPAGPTAQSASVGVHLADAREVQPPPAPAPARTGISVEAQRNVVISAGLLLITACIIGGETGLKLGTLAGFVAVLVAVG